MKITSSTSRRSGIALLVGSVVVLGFLSIGYWRGTNAPTVFGLQAATTQATRNQPYPLPQTPTPPGTLVAPTLTPIPTLINTPTPTPPYATPNPAMSPAHLTMPSAIQASVPMRLAGVGNDRYIVGMFSPPGTRIPRQPAQFAVIDLITGDEFNLTSFKAGGGDLIDGRWMPFAIVTPTVPLQGIQMIYDQVQRTAYAAQNFETPVAISVSLGEHLWVHQVDRHSNPSDYDIFAYDLVAGKDFPIIVRPGAQTFPKLAGRWLAYLDFAYQSGEIRLHNLDTAEDSPLGTVLHSYPGNFAISQNEVVWFSGQSGRFELHVYDIGRRTQFLLNAPFKGEPGAPSVSNGIVVYGNFGDWVVYDIVRDSVIQMIPRDPNTSIATVRISGNRVIWDVTDLRVENSLGMFSANIAR